MKNLFRFVLVLSLLSFTSCTTLTADEECALSGQVLDGFLIGTQTNITSVKGQIYSYKTRSYNPICKFPKTKEEKMLVTEMISKADEKKKQRDKESLIFYGSLLVATIALAFGVKMQKESE